MTHRSDILSLIVGLCALACAPEPGQSGPEYSLEDGLWARMSDGSSSSDTGEIWTEDTPSDPPEEGPEMWPEDTPSDLPEEGPEMWPEDTPSDLPEEVPEVWPEDTPSDLPEEVPEDAPEDVPWPEEAPRCSFVVGLQSTVSSPVDKDNTTSFCDDVLLEQEFIAASGADLRLFVDGGRPQAADAHCVTSLSGTKTTRLEAELMVLSASEDNPGDCPSLDAVALRVQTALFAGLATEQTVSTYDLGESFFPVPGASVLFSASASSMPEVGGSDLERTIGGVRTTLSWDCRTTHRVVRSLGFRTPGATRGRKYICGNDAFDVDFSLPAKASMDGKAVLSLDSEGPSVTTLYAAAHHSAVALSTGCAEGSTLIGCDAVRSRGEVQTTRLCLEVQAESACSVVPPIEGVSCTVAAEAQRVSVGSCG
jgi:hypothetical protein